MVPTFADFVKAHSSSIDRMLSRDVSDVQIWADRVPEWLHCGDATHTYGMRWITRFGYLQISVYWSEKSGWFSAA